MSRRKKEVEETPKRSALNFNVPAVLFLGTTRRDGSAPFGLNRGLEPAWDFDPCAVTIVLKKEKGEICLLR